MLDFDLFLERPVKSTVCHPNLVHLSDDYTSSLWNKQRVLVRCSKLNCMSTMSDFVEFYYRIGFQLVNIFFSTWQVSLREIRCNLQLFFK